MKYIFNSLPSDYMSDQILKTLEEQESIFAGKCILHEWNFISLDIWTVYKKIPPNTSLSMNNAFYSKKLVLKPLFTTQKRLQRIDRWI